MPIFIDVPRSLDDDEISSKPASAAEAAAGNSIDIALAFFGIPLTNDTDVHVRIPCGGFYSTVGDLRNAIALWALEQRGGDTAGAAAAKAAAESLNITLNFGGVKLTDWKEQVSHAVRRVTQGKTSVFALKALPKIYVSGTAGGGGSGSGGADAGAGAGTRRARGGAGAGAGAAAGGGGDGTPELSPEMADAMANMISSNPALIESMLNADPSMREMMRTNPEIARMMRDPSTIRELLRQQSTREGRRQSDTEQRAALAFIQTHPDGNAMIERALGREGALSDTGPNSMFGIRGGGESIADVEQQQQLQQQDANTAGPLLPGGSAAANPAAQMANLFGASGAGGAGGAAPGGLPAFDPAAAAALFGAGGPPVPPPPGGGMDPFAAMFPGMQQPHQQQPQQQQPQRPQQQADADAKAVRIAQTKVELVAMEIDEEMAALAAEQSDGSLEKALALIEEWQN